MKVGDRLGEYEIVERMATGGMGTILRARHRLMNRIVVVKVIREDVADRRLPMMFRREIEASARLSHPNVLTVFDAGTGPSGAYLVSEYLSGGDLDGRVRRQGPLPVAMALNFATQAARGLQAMHEAGIIHRDVKPSNLLLDDSETIQVIDFGIVKLLSESGDPRPPESPRGPATRPAISDAGTRIPAPPSPYGQTIVSRDEQTLPTIPRADAAANGSAEATLVPAPPSSDDLPERTFFEQVVDSRALLTMAPRWEAGTYPGADPAEPHAASRWGATIGTPAYMSPEQWQGRDVDARTDIYALGCTLFFLLTAENILAGNLTRMAEIGDKKLRGETRAPGELRDDVPEGLDRLIRRMTALDPNDRFESMGHVVSALEEVDAEPKVFFSYRREDSLDATDRLYSGLSKRIDPRFLFLDVDSIPAGVDFRPHLEAQVAGCDVVLAVIGDHWLARRDEDGSRRIDDPSDFVRHEILFALKQGVPVIPVLVGRALMPEARDLPDEIEPLAQYQAAEVRAGPSYESAVEKLLGAVFDIWRGRGLAVARSAGSAVAESAGRDRKRAREQ